MKMQDRSKQILTSLLTAALCYGSVASAQSRKAALAKASKSARSLKAVAKPKALYTAAANDSSEIKDKKIAQNTLSSKDVMPVSSMQTQTNVTKMQVPEALSEDPNKRLSVATGMEYSQAISSEDRGKRESSTDFELGLTYKTSDLTTMTAKASVSKDNTGQKDTTISNTQIILGIKGYTFNDQLKSAHSVTGVAPTSEASQNEDRIKGAINISNGFTYTVPGIKIDYRLGLTKNFHEFTFNYIGRANVEYSMANSLALDIPVVDGFHVSMSGTYKNGQSYGKFARSSFVFAADLNFDLSNTFAMNIGTTNEAAALKANGTDSNLSAYDEKTSLVRAGLAYSY